MLTETKRPPVRVSQEELARMTVRKRGWLYPNEFVVVTESRWMYNALEFSGRSVLDFAHSVGFSARDFARILAGTHPVRFGVLRYMSRLLKIDPLVLIPDYVWLRNGLPVFMDGRKFYFDGGVLQVARQRVGMEEQTVAARAFLERHARALNETDYARKWSAFETHQGATQGRDTKQGWCPVRVAAAVISDLQERAHAYPGAIVTETKHFLLPEYPDVGWSQGGYGERVSKDLKE